MVEMKDVIRERIGTISRGYKLAELQGRKAKAHHIYAIRSFQTGVRRTELAIVAFRIFFAAIDISTQAEFQFEVICFRRGFLIMVNHHPRILDRPLRMSLVSADGILNGSGYLLIFLLEYDELILHQRLPVSEGQYIGRVVHNKIAKLHPGA